MKVPQYSFSISYLKFVIVIIFIYIYFWHTLQLSIFTLGIKTHMPEVRNYGFWLLVEEYSSSNMFLFWKDGEEEDPWMKIVLISQEAPINHLYTLRYTLGSENIPPEKQMRSYGSLGIISYYLFFSFYLFNITSFFIFRNNLWN